MMNHKLSMGWTAEGDLQSSHASSQSAEACWLSRQARGCVPSSIGKMTGSTMRKKAHTSLSSSWPRKSLCARQSSSSWRRCARRTDAFSPIRLVCLLISDDDVMILARTG